MAFQQLQVFLPSNVDLEQPAAASRPNVEFCRINNLDFECLSDAGVIFEWNLNFGKIILYLDLGHAVVRSVFGLFFSFDLQLFIVIFVQKERRFQIELNFVWRAAAGSSLVRSNGGQLIRDVLLFAARSLHLTDLATTLSL